MKRATEVVRAGRWPAGERVDSVTLLFDDRYRRRLRMLGDGGTDFLLDLIEPIVLHGGDGLKLEEGGFVEVKAAEEDLVEVRGRDAAAFARLAWHLGNRHLPAHAAGARTQGRRGEAGGRVRDQGPPRIAGRHEFDEGGARRRGGVGVGGGRGACKGMAEAIRLEPAWAARGAKGRSAAGINGLAY